jgi:hypothetical protein
MVYFPNIQIMYLNYSVAIVSVYTISGMALKIKYKIQ